MDLDSINILELAADTHQSKLSARKKQRELKNADQNELKKLKAKLRDQEINKQLKAKLDEINLEKKAKADKIRKKCTSCTNKKPLPPSMRNIDNVNNAKFYKRGLTASKMATAFDEEIQMDLEMESKKG